MITNNTSFTKIVDAAYNLSIDYKLELLNLLEHNIAQEKRDEIHKNHKLSMEEKANNKLVFSSNITKLKKML